ncbi:hypothetical protein F8B43_2248 [Methylorubrum populi]|uniref:Uncharacterized protein n=1 Tax=Methylorubrum populi TaxID=223967 RepID=A0A833N1D6_9HYPH|nr:hypothetical protein F8B43_2248 [Methylorubrum populi]
MVKGPARAAPVPSFVSKDPLAAGSMPCRLLTHRVVSEKPAIRLRDDALEAAIGGQRLPASTGFREACG